MNTAPLYPKAWNIWSVAMVGDPDSSVEAQLVLMDDLTRAQLWLEFTLSDVSNVGFIEKPATGTKAIRRREQMDVIPVLPAGVTHNRLVRFFYDGDQESIAWPHDDQFMLLVVYSPDVAKPAPVSMIEKFESGASDLLTGSLKALNSTLWAIAGAALALGVGWYIFTSTPKRLSERAPTSPSE